LSVAKHGDHNYVCLVKMSRILTDNTSSILTVMVSRDMAAGSILRLRTSNISLRI